MPRLTPALLSEYLRFFVSLGVGLLLTPLLLQYFGKDQFGVWITLGSLVGTFGVLDLGLGGSMPKLFAEHFATGNLQALNRLISTLLTFFTAGALFLLLALIPLSLPLERFLHIPDGYLEIGRVTLLILSLNFSVSFVANVLYSLLFGMQKLQISNMIGIVALLFLITAIAGALYFGYGLVGVALANLGSNLFGFLTTFFYLKKRFPHLHIRWGIFDWPLLKKALSLSLYVFVGNIGMQVIFNTDNLVISRFLGLAQVATYAIAFRLCYFCMNFVFNFSKVFLPRFSELHATNKMELLGETFLKLSRVSVTTGGCLVVVLFFFGETLIRFWTRGPYFVGDNTFFTLILLLLTTPAIQAGTTTLLGMGKIKATTCMILAEAVLNITLSIFLAGPLGVWGVACGTVLAQWATNGWFVPWYTLRKLQLPAKTYWKRVLLPGMFVWILLFFAIWSVL
ncbi:MAG: oligosaccharide flippase family protein [Deltaproteobacteria bacterium]|nr:oligosaccharide flippase family protein [Deltaproteobacteria bacterium]